MMSSIFDAVKVHWCFLPFADNQEFFCVWPLVWAPLNSVPPAKQNEAAFLEPPCAEVRDVPSHLMCAAERGDVRMRRPVRRRPTAPGWDCEAVSDDERLGFYNQLVDLGPLHCLTSRAS